MLDTQLPNIDVGRLGAVTAGEELAEALADRPRLAAVLPCSCGGGGGIAAAAPASARPCACASASWSARETRSSSPSSSSPAA